MQQSSVGLPWQPQLLGNTQLSIIHSRSLTDEERASERVPARPGRGEEEGGESGERRRGPTLKYRRRNSLRGKSKEVLLQFQHPPQRFFFYFLKPPLTGTHVHHRDNKDSLTLLTISCSTDLFMNDICLNYES